MSEIGISAETANDLRFEDEVNQFVVVHRETVDQLRWESVELVVFRCCVEHPRFFEFEYTLPLTENQEIEDFEQPVTCKEVFPREKTVVVYE